MAVGDQCAEYNKPHQLLGISQVVYTAAVGDLTGCFISYGCYRQVYITHTDV